MSPRPEGPALAALDEWLTKRNGFCLWQKRLSHGYLEGWKVARGVVIIHRYGDKTGFQVYTATDSIGIEETFADAEKRLGIT